MTRKPDPLTPDLMAGKAEKDKVEKAAASADKLDAILAAIQGVGEKVEDLSNRVEHLEASEEALAAKKAAHEALREPTGNLHEAIEAAQSQGITDGPKRVEYKGRGGVTVRTTLPSGRGLDENGKPLDTGAGMLPGQGVRVTGKRTSGQVGVVSEVQNPPV